MSGKVRPAGALAIAFLTWGFGVQPAMSQTLVQQLFPLKFAATADSNDLPPPQTFGLLVQGGGKVEFRYVGAALGYGSSAIPGTVIPSPFVVSPSTGVAPTAIWVALNPNVVPYLPPGTYTAILRFAPSAQASNPVNVAIVDLSLRGSIPQIQSVVSAASFQPVISPGQIVSIFGSHLGAAPLTVPYNGAGVYPAELSNKDWWYQAGGAWCSNRDGVTFNGTAAPLLYSSSSQINAIVPYGVAGQSSVSVVATHNCSQASLSVPLKETSPAIFTAGQTGTGQGAILNATSVSNIATPNSTSNPAPQGSVITLFATGFGLLQQAVPDGTVLFGCGAVCPRSDTSSACWSPCGPDVALFPATTLSVTIGGRPAPLEYVGPSPGSPAAILQVNARVPTGIGSGPQPIVLTVGQNNNAQQQVTIAVQ